MDFQTASKMIHDAYFIAEDHYDEAGLAHACRVAEYVDQNAIIDDFDKEPCIALALLHDLFEDTLYYEELSSKIAPPLDESIMKALCALTKPDHLSYVDYIKSIKNTQGETWRKWAYFVKLADMKDHLCQRETLTNKLKEKYWEAIPYLL